MCASVVSLCMSGSPRPRRPVGSAGGRQVPLSVIVTLI